MSLPSLLGLLSWWKPSTKSYKKKQANNSAMGSTSARLENESTDRLAPTAVPEGEDIQPPSSSVKPSMSRKSSRQKDSGGVPPLPSPPTASDQLSAPASPTPETRAVFVANLELSVDVNSVPPGTTTPIEATSATTTASCIQSLVWYPPEPIRASNYSDTSLDLTRAHHPISHDELERGPPTGPANPISPISLYERTVIDISQPANPFTPLYQPGHSPSGKESYSSGSLLNSAWPEPPLEQPSQDEGTQGQVYNNLSETGAEDDADQEGGYLQLPTSAGASTRPTTPEDSRLGSQSPGDAICKPRIFLPPIRVDQEEHSDWETDSRPYFSALSSIRSTASSFVGLHPFPVPALPLSLRRTLSVALPPRTAIHRVLNSRTRALSSQEMATSPGGLSTTPSLPASSFPRHATSYRSISSHIQYSSHRNSFGGRRSTRLSLGEPDIKEDSAAPQGVPDTQPPPPKQMSSQDILRRLLDHGCVDLSSNMDSSQYSAGLVIGGAFGDVWRGKLLDGTEVAIKVWRFCSIMQDGHKPMKRAMREIYNWSKADHENIQRLMGVILFQGRLGMVSLWMKHGNLRDYILNFPRVDRYSLCGQVAAGVAYLHGCKMVHGDLKAANVLVSEDGICKLSDFDHSIISECSLALSITSNQGGGTTRWMAPELFGEYSSRGLRTDIYALGMTMLEIVTGTLPYYPQFKIEPQVVLAVSQGKLPERPTTYFGDNALGNQMWALLLRCWDREPSVRPEAAEVLELVQTIASMSKV